MNSSQKKYAIIVGAMKSGTTSLYKYLCSHPQICRCRKKEPEFFSENQEHGATVEKYDDLWQFRPEHHKYRLEASTGYTKFPFEKRVPKRMKKYGINPKFIYIVRDPAERIESQRNFMEIELDIEVDGFEDPRLTELSKYFQQLERFRRVFPEEGRYLILDFDELKSNTNKLLERCAEFLAVAPDGFPVETRTHGKTPTRKLDVWLGRVGEIKNRIGRLLPDRQRRAIKGFLQTLTPEVDHVEMSPSERRAVRRELRPDIEKFGEEFEFEISKWGF